MKYRYTKFTGDDLDELDLEELLSKLSEMLLGSGFEDPHGLYGDEEDGHSRQSLHDAILEAILNGGMRAFFLIVVLSSHADESVQVRSLLAGALDHLAKPFNVRVLMAKLLRWTAISARCQAAA